MTNKIADAFLMCERRKEAETLIAKANRFAARNGYTIDRIYFKTSDTDPRLLDKVIDSLPLRNVRLIIFSEPDALGDDEMIRRERRINILKADAKFIFLKAGTEKSYALYWLNTIMNYNSYALDWEIRIGAAEKPVPHKITNGSKPYGYDSENGYYAINEEQAKDIRLIFDLYDSGLNASAIMEKLDESGSGHHFPVSSIMSILQNGHYAGTDRKKAGTVPAIIKNGQFLRVRARIEKNRKDGPAAYPFLLDNVYFMTGSTKIRMRPAGRNRNHGKPVYCGRTGDSLILADAEKLENAVTDRLCEDLSENLDAECEEVLTFAETKKVELLRYMEKTKKQKETLKSEFDAVFGTYAGMQAVRRGNIGKFDELKTALDEINRKLNNAQIMLELCSQNKNEIYDFFETMKQLPGMQRCEAGFFLNRLISKVLLSAGPDKSGITVECHYGGGREITFPDTQIFSIKPLEKPLKPADPQAE